MALNHDREFRRLGMVYAAENSLKEVEKDPAIKAECDAYTAGVNAYIESLSESQLPIEYKLIGYKPEKWSNLKTALFLKYMSYDLAAHEDDFEMTNAKNYFSKKDFALLVPAKKDSVDPIIPSGTIYPKPTIQLTIPSSVDSIYFSDTVSTTITQEKPDKDNGSNNWAVSGKKRKVDIQFLQMILILV
ncbi:MAG: penicillin acylase family protein [Chitinophagaceae bacterium]